MPTNEYTSEQLLERALELLSGQYDIDVDSFFLIVTKDAKNENQQVPGTQIVVGELETRAVLTFIIHAIQQLSAVNNLPPYMFISRYILGHFIAEEKRAIEAAHEEDIFTPGEPVIGLEDDEDEAARTNMLIYDKNLMDIEN
jgi:hypothetical protein